MLAYRRVSIGMETNIALFILFWLAMRLPLQDIASCCSNPKIKIGPENQWLEYQFSFGEAYFQGYLSLG